MTTIEKKKYRQSKEWKDFRTKLLEEVDYTCYICQIRKKKGLHVHHHDESNYTDLDPSKFSVLCSSCHRELERLLRRKEFSLSMYLSNFSEVYKKSA